MKTNAIVRIVLYSIAIIVLTGILLTGLGIGMFMVDTDSDYLPVAGDGKTNRGIVDAAQVQNIKIDWVSGPIMIRTAENTKQITFTETAPNDEKHQMVFSHDGDTLKIQFEKDTVKFGINNDISKALTITVPADWNCNSLEIETASSDVEVCDMTIHEVSFDGASGICSFSNCNVGDLDVNTASGNVNFTGTLTSLECEAASGSCDVMVSNNPDSISIEAASGDLELYLPEDCGFTADIDTMSGDFNSDFAITKENKQFVHGNGGCRIDVSAMSGNVGIYKCGTADAATVPYCTAPTCNDASHDHSDTDIEQEDATESHGHTSSHHN